MVSTRAVAVSGMSTAYQGEWLNTMASASVISTSRQTPVSLGRLWARLFNGSWANWTDAFAGGGVLGSEPAAVARTGGVVDVFIRGTDGAVWHVALGNL